MFQKHQRAIASQPAFARRTHGRHVCRVALLRQKLNIFCSNLADSQASIHPSIRPSGGRKKERLPSFFVCWRGFCGGTCRWCLRRANGRTKVIKQIDSERQSVTSRSLVWAGGLIFGTQSKQDPDARFNKAEEEQRDQEQHRGYGVFTKCHQT